MTTRLLRFLRDLPLLLLALPAVAIAKIALASRPRMASGRPSPPRAQRKADTRAASLVVPNWNGRDLLERFLPSWIASIAPHPGSEIVIVDNGSTDGSAAWLRTHYPQVRLLALEKKPRLRRRLERRLPRRAQPRRRPAQQRHARRVGLPRAPARRLHRRNRLRRLLPDLPRRQIEAPRRDRSHASLVAGWRPGVTHREDPAVDRLFPCFYGGGGSCAFDRAKFLDLGGFDGLLAPFYLEDTDLDFSPGSAVGKCSISRRAWSITSIAAPSQDLQPRLHPIRAAEELHPVRLEEHSRMGRLASHFFFAMAAR